MITRQEAVNQADRCLEYHAALAAGIIGIVALVDRRAFAWWAASLGTGVALHATCLHLIPSTRETLLRTTASMMEDLQHVNHESSSQPQQLELAGSHS